MAHRSLRKLSKMLFRRLGFRVSRISNSAPGKRGIKKSKGNRPESRTTPSEPAGNRPDSTLPDDPFAEMRFLCQSIPAPIIFDVGAHHGSICLLYRSLFPEATIYAFEPFVESFEILKTNTAHDPKIQVFNVGFSDSEGIRTFHSNAASFTNSLLATDERGAETWGPDFLETKEIVNARFTTLDSFIHSMNLPRVDILKLDAQGAEHLIMEGARQSSLAGKFSIVYSEIIIQPTYKNQKRLDEALHQFHSLGFDLHNIYNLSKTAGGKLRQVDAIFVKSGFQMAAEN